MIGLSILLGILTSYIPNLIHWNNEPVFGLEFGGNYSKYKWIGWGYPILTFLWLGASSFIMGKEMFEIMLFPLFLGILNGLFAIVTGISVLIENRSYMYVYEPNKARYVGFMQSMIAIVFVYFL